MRDELDRLSGGLLMPETEGVGVGYPVDIHEDDDNVYVEAEMPGFSRDDIDARVEGDMLQIDAERKEEQRETKEVHRERRYARVARRLPLPSAVDESKVEAKYEDGVLRLTLPKTEGSRSRRIEVK
jgi:HSP20 family protein